MLAWKSPESDAAITRTPTKDTAGSGGQYYGEGDCSVSISGLFTDVNSGIEGTYQLLVCHVTTITKA